MKLWLFIFAWEPRNLDNERVGVVRWYDRWVVVTPWPDEMARLKMMGGKLVEEIEL